MLEVSIIIWAILSAGVGVAAGARGRKANRWFVLSLLISPLFAVLILIAMPPRAHGRRRCPHCGKLIKDEATVCRFCNKLVIPHNVRATLRAWQQP